jgi:hypothetical protein
MAAKVEEAKIFYEVSPGHIPEIGKCYEHTLYSSKEERNIKNKFGHNTGKTETHFFSTTPPTYLGKFIGDNGVDAILSGEHQHMVSHPSSFVFENKNGQSDVRLFVETCFIEVPCRDDTGGGRRKRKSRRKKHRKKRTKKKHRRKTKRKRRVKRRRRTRRR